MIFLKKLTLNYNHFDSKDPSNKDQIKIQSSCHKIGLQLIQQIKNQNLKNVDLIIQNEEENESNFLTMNLNFGNQNIKE
jgi:hypothetical protein